MMHTREIYDNIDATNNSSSNDKDGEEDGGVLVCVAMVEFKDGLGSIAKIMVESEDETLMLECTSVSPKFGSGVGTHGDGLIYYESL